MKLNFKLCTYSFTFQNHYIRHIVILSVYFTPRPASFNEQKANMLSLMQDKIANILARKQPYSQSDRASYLRPASL